MTIDPKDPRLIAQAPLLYDIAKVIAGYGICLRREPREKEDSDCQCTWHLCVRAVAAVERDNER